MRLVFLHSDSIEFEPREKALDSAENVRMEKQRIDEALVVLSTVESGDEGLEERVAEEIRDVAARLNAKRIVIYPWAHLSKHLADPETALTVLKRIENILSADFEVYRAPFGWYKKFSISVKGHPLSELSREIKQEDVSKALKEEEKLESYWYILTPDGDLIPVDDFDFSNYPKLRKFVDYEIRKNRIADSEPPHVRIMRELDLVDYEEGSDSGNLRYYPKGRVIKKLLERYVSEKVISYGAMEVETPIMYDFQHPTLAKYLHRFPARQYVVLSGDRRYFLRFAACFGQFLMKHDMVISYKHLPVRMYELTRYSFRREQSGEVVGLKRLRAFTMPDMHTLVPDIDSALSEFRKQYELSMDVLNGVGLSKDDYEVAVRIVKDFYEENKEFVKNLAKLVGKPILVEMWDKKPFYFILKFEFNFVDCQDKASALSTVQIDVENAERYGITYVDDSGSKKHPLILHCSPSGAIERVMYAVLEKRWMEREKKKPHFPTWLSPTQVRLIPVSGEQIEYVVRLAEYLRGKGVRVDVDDREASLSKKILEAEREWIPYVCVVGGREVSDGSVSLRDRVRNTERKLFVDELVRMILSECEGFPKEPLPLPLLLSKRPKFH